MSNYTIRSTRGRAPMNPATRHRLRPTREDILREVNDAIRELQAIREPRVEPALKRLVTIYQKATTM